MFTEQQARELLYAANVFFDNKIPHELNMNDVWGWACADSCEVSDKELAEVAELFFKYGWCGILYWVAKKQGIKKSEFADNNRFIKFVKHEEAIRKEIPSSSERAYHKTTYVIE